MAVWKYVSRLPEYAQLVCVWLPNCLLHNGLKHDQRRSVLEDPFLFYSVTPYI